ncbi:MAG: hypothetical protein QF489_02550, partial [Planctomycetota bacterium]|nr:hypothetical protein [Planctomycetota bacterium]
MEQFLADLSPWWKAFAEAWLLPGCSACGQLDGLRPSQDWWFPSFCSPCHDAWPEPAGPQPDLGLDSRLALWAYGGSVRRLLVQAKEIPHGAQAWALAYFMREAFAQLHLPYPAVWTTPPPSRKRRWRDWYLPDFLAKQGCRAYGQEYQSLLRRRHQTKDQGELDGSARRANLKGNFQYLGNGGHTRSPTRVILFDDVSTTGATMVEATRALREAGVQEVHGLSLAAVPWTG